MSSIGAMFAPHHQAVADELVRVCRPGGKIGLLSWTPEGMLGALFRTIGPFAPPPPAGAQPPPLWGSEEHLRGLFGGRVDWTTLERDVLEITAFERPQDYGEHFKGRYGPAIAARANAEKDGRDGRVRPGAGRVLRRVEPGHAGPGPVREGVPGRGRHARGLGAQGRPQPGGHGTRGEVQARKPRGHAGQAIHPLVIAEAPRATTATSASGPSTAAAVATASAPGDGSHQAQTPPRWRPPAPRTPSPGCR